MLILLVATIFVSIVDSHSILRTPASWNTRESKNNPCGGRTPAQAREAPTQTTPGADVTGLWEVTAGDGNGPISIVYVETDAEATRAGFDAAEAAGKTLAVTMNPIPQRGTGRYPFTFKAPPASAQCTGGPQGNACHIRVKSTSNWYSCASLALPAAPTPAPIPAQTIPPTRSPTTLAPTASQCETLQGAEGSMCAGLNGSPVKPNRATVTDRITGAVGEFNLLVNNGIVFRNSVANTMCQQYLAQILCGLNFQNCDTANPGVAKAVCKSRCINTMYECDVDPLHTSALLERVCEGSDFSEMVGDGYGACPATLQTRNINLKSILVGTQEGGYWTSGQNYPSEMIYKGDKLVWKYSGTTTLYKFPDEAAFQNCDFASSVEMVGTADTSVEGGLTTYTLDTSEAMYSAGQTLWFGSKIGCVPDAQTNNDGVSTKVQVSIIAIPTGANVVSASSINGPEERPAEPPTMSPPGFLGNPGDNMNPGESGSLGQFSFCFFAMICSVLLMF